MNMNRCEWSLGDEAYLEYHDKEWGVPVKNDNKWFEFLVLESAQAGLSWLTILRKRENYRKAFMAFDPEKVSKFGPAVIEELLQNPGIIRNRLKIEAAVNNAGVFLEIQSKFGSFNDYMWQFVDGKPIKNRWEKMSDIPAQTPLSVKITKEMKNLGFRFFGPVICYAHMQATGMVNDHLISCFRYSEL